MLARGTPITVSVSGSANSVWTSPNFWSGTDTDTVRSSVNASLLGIADVQSFVIKDRGFLDVGTWQYSATLVLAPKGDYNRPEDFASFVRTAFYDATGFLPTLSITAIGSRSTGQPRQPEVEPPTIPGLDALTTGAWNTLLLIGVVLIGMVYAFGKSGGRLV